MQRKRLVHPLGTALCALALLLISVTVYAQPAKGRTITGTVLDTDAKPVAHATVAAPGGTPTATTGDDGSFTLANVPNANVVLDVTAEGFTAKQVPVLNGNTPLQLSLVIVRPAPPAPPATRAIGGVVTDAQHAPIAGATVRVHGTELQVQTDADGSFTLPGVPATEVALDIEAPNQPPTTATVAANKAAIAVTVGVAPAAPTSRSVHGKIIDPTTKEPIVAAQVQVAGTETVVFTEADGAFALDGLPPGPVQLEVTAPEHEKRTINVAADQPTIDISLALVQGEQIIIEGRAPVIVKESLAHGSSTIGSKDLTRVSASTLDEAMQGKLAGANLQQNSGAPGGGAQLRLRGVSTINGQSSPLYVIDGVIISNVATPSGANILTSAAAGGNTSTQDNPVNRIADLNPNDIERVEVLKGASAAALYGSKAANGVIVITTKHGKNGENHAEITQRFGFAQVSNSLGSRTFTSADEVATAFGVAADSALVKAFNAANGKTYDHEAEIERTPFMRETIASVSGGTDNSSYFASALLNDEPGVVIGTFYQKQSGRLSIGYKFSDRVRLNVSANLIHSVSDRGVTNNDNAGVSNFVVLSGTPNFLNLNPTNGIYPTNIAPAVGAGTNPLQTVQLLQNREDVWRLITGSTLSIDAYKSEDGKDKVTVLGNFGADDFTQHNNILSPNQLIFEAADGLPGTSVSASTTNLNWNVGAGAIWDHKSDSFRNAVSAGVTYESVDLDSVYTFAQNLNASQPNVDSGAAISITENRLRTKDSGVYAQEELAVLNEQLSILGGLLFERSSLNGDTDKYYIYPKIAGVYSLIPPDSKQGLAEYFDSLRVRAAYGEAGNRPNYGQKFTALNATTNIDGNAGLILGTRGQPGSIGDAKIEPERQREFELGVDAATKDEKIAVELTGYQRNISNLLLQRSLATSTGYTTQFLNGGGLRNRGIEATVTVRPLPTNKLLEWIARATLTLNRSQITDLPANVPTFDITAAGFGTGLGAYRIEVGKSATQIVATIGNGQVAAVGNGEPDFRVGWSNVVTAGDWSFSALLDWQHGSNIINLTRLLYDGNSLSPDVAAMAKRLTTFGNGDARPYIEDASFVKLREISISYTLPKHLLEYLGPVKTLSANLSGRNLLTFTGYSGLDPEVSNFGAQPIGRNYDVGPYPPSRSYWLSITAGI